MGCHAALPDRKRNVKCIKREGMYVHLASNEREPLLLPFAGPCLGWFNDKGHKLLHSILLFQVCNEAGIQCFAFLHTRQILRENRTGDAALLLS